MKNEDIKEQLSKMREALPEGNMVIVYSGKGYYAETGELYTYSNSVSTKVGDYIADTFIGCKKGKWGVEYDVDKKRIRMPESDQTNVILKHILNIKIKEN